MENPRRAMAPYPPPPMHMVIFYMLLVIDRGRELDRDKISMKMRLVITR